MLDNRIEIGGRNSWSYWFQGFGVSLDYFGIELVFGFFMLDNRVMFYVGVNINYFLEL